MEQIILDGERMQTPQQTQQYIKEAVLASDCYGESLDALYDVLTSITSETQLVLINWQAAQAQLGSYAESLFCMMEDASTDNDNLMLELA